MMLKRQTGVYGQSTRYQIMPPEQWLGGNYPPRA